jgi:hypothetical protein
MPTKQNFSELEPLLDAQQRHLSLIMAESSSTDSKALGIGAANIAILIFIAQANLTFTGWWDHALLLVTFILSLLFNTLAIIPHRYLGAGADLEKSPEYLAMDRETLVLQLISNTETAIKTNDKLNALRWRYCVASLVLTTIGSAALFVIL